MFFNREPLGTMPNYDFNFQNSQPIQRTIMPGDTLIHHCSFSTKNTSYSVYGGESSMQEMCFNFMVVCLFICYLFSFLFLF